jgi:hypothetical protein
MLVSGRGRELGSMTSSDTQRFDALTIAVKLTDGSEMVSLVRMRVRMEGGQDEGAGSKERVKERMERKRRECPFTSRTYLDIDLGRGQ